MMPHAAEALIATFEKNNVLSVAIVDDGYDPPDTTVINEQRWIGLTVAVDDLNGKLGRHAKILGDIGELPTYGGLRNDEVHKLWGYLVDLEIGDPECLKTDTVAKALKSVFQSFSGQRIQKRAQLRHVERAAFEATGKEPECFPSTVNAAALKGFDLIFMDFFLGDEADPADERINEKLSLAQENACRLVREVSIAAKPNATPLFVVISSLATNDNVPQFRDSAELLASKFRFLSKTDIEKDPARRDFVLRSLVSQRAAGDAVEKLTADWEGSIRHALDDMMKSIRRLDLADYAYLQTYRLTDEKISLLNYLTWLYNGYLSSFVEERLAKTDADTTKPLVEFTKPSAVLRPMSEIPRIYSRITTTRVSDFGDSPAPKIWTGDLFVRKAVLGKYAIPEAAAPAEDQDLDAQVAVPPAPAGDAAPAVEGKQTEEAGATADASLAPKEKQEPELPDVVAAVTPVCDLVPGREKARTVMLLGGELTELGKAKEASNHLLVYDRPGGLPDQGVEFLIKWDPKWPLAYPRSAFDGEGVLGTDYMRVTRLRELYAAEIAQSMAADLARVGVPIAPPFTRPLDVQVRIAGRKTPILSTVGVSQRPYAWDLHKKKTGAGREWVFSETFLWDLRAAVKANAPADHAGLVLVDDLANLEPLLQPFPTSNKTPNPAQPKLVVREETVAPTDVQKPGNNEIIVISVFAID